MKVYNKLAQFIAHPRFEDLKDAEQAGLDAVAAHGDSSPEADAAADAYDEIYEEIHADVFR